MKLVAASGTAREIGLATGEHLREEIRETLDVLDERGRPAEFEQRLPEFVAAAQRQVPLVVEEMQATAEGANLAVEDIYRLNFPLYANELVIAEGCTNIVFASGPEGPVWGKNNDGIAEQRRLPPCARLVRREGMIPLLTFTFCGMVATLDGMNAAGLAVGHSSVGSVFQQSDRHVPIRLWGYEGMLRCGSAAEFVDHMAAVPTRDKGYATVCVDRKGVTCSIEAPVPLLQVRRARHPAGHMHCVNCYQLPALAEADRRTPEGKGNAQARWRMLDEWLEQSEDFSMGAMRGLLQHHEEPAICRHGVKEESLTEYSMIGLPQSGLVYYRHGLACEGEFEVVKVC